MELQKSSLLRSALAQKPDLRPALRQHLEVQWKATGIAQMALGGGTTCIFAVATPNEDRFNIIRFDFSTFTGQTLAAARGGNNQLCFALVFDHLVYRSAEHDGISTQPLGSPQATLLPSTDGMVVLDQRVGDAAFIGSPPPNGVSGFLICPTLAGDRLAMKDFHKRDAPYVVAATMMGAKATYRVFVNRDQPEDVTVDAVGIGRESFSYTRPANPVRGPYVSPTQLLTVDYGQDDQAPRYRPLGTATSWPENPSPIEEDADEETYLGSGEPCILFDGPTQNYLRLSGDTLRVFGPGMVRRLHLEIELDRHSSKVSHPQAQGNVIAALCDHQVQTWDAFTGSHIKTFTGIGDTRVGDYLLLESGLLVLDTRDNATWYPFPKGGTPS